MTLDNLLRIGQLKHHTTGQAEIADLLAAARRNLSDAGATNISTENRFDAAYKCIMQCALVGLMANGFRPDTKVPGHHQTVIQSLPKSMSIPTQRIAVLDTLRNKRNLSDYTGKAIDFSSLVVCIEQAGQLLEETIAWLTVNHPELSS
jgi:hypothetical protein